jgi:hypothetical protein
MAEGRSNSAIAATLAITDRAVDKHVANIFAKLGLPVTETDHRWVLPSCGICIPDSLARAAPIATSFLVAGAPQSTHRGARSVAHRERGGVQA